MTFRVRVRTATQTREHVLELPAESGLTRARQGVLRLQNNGQPLEIDWAQVSAGVFSILMGGRAYQVRVATPAEDPGGRTGAWTVTLGNAQARVEIAGARDPGSRAARQATRTSSSGDGPQEIRAPMPGKIVKVLVQEEQDVSPGQGLLVIEAMKMQNELRAPRAGRVEKVYAQEGKGVESGTPLLRLA